MNASESNSTSLADSVVGIVARNPKTCASVGYLAGSLIYQKLMGMQLTESSYFKMHDGDGNPQFVAKSVGIAGLAVGINSYTSDPIIQ